MLNERPVHMPEPASPAHAIVPGHLTRGQGCQIARLLLEELVPPG